MAYSKIYLLVLFLNCMVSACAQALLKKGATKQFATFLQQYLNFFVVLGYGLFFVVVLLNIWLLKYLPLLIVNPITTALTLSFSFFTGYVFFGEKITRNKIIGGLCIIIGVCIIAV